MKIEIDLKSTNHKFEKQNLITQMNGKESYDTYKCECGAKGKRPSLTDVIFLDGRTSKTKAYNCPLSFSIKEIYITHCAAFGKVFANLTPGSTHDVIDPPEGKNNDNGIWVMGVGEPVKVLHGEFKHSTL